MTAQVLPAHVDVIVIGAGTAGAACAGRLAVSTDRSILVLEAGPDPRGADVPPDFSAGSSLAAAYDPRVSDGVAVDLGDGRRTELRRGRVVGGSSAVNGAYFVRGRPEDFARWEALGNTAWAPSAVLASFERLEHDLDVGDRPGHGAHGPMPVARDLTPSKVTDAFFAACAAADHVESDDLNAPGPTDIAGVFGFVPRNVRRSVTSDPASTEAERDGDRRVSTAAYLDPLTARPNLTVLGGRTVQRVVVHDGRAIGVELHDGEGTTRVVTADEIVLSAGAVGSAELLVRSGIGPADLLRTHGVDVVHDAPGVGTASFDHPCIDLMYRPVDGVVDLNAPSFLHGAMHLDTGIEVMATRLPYGVVTDRDRGDELLSLRVTLTLPTARGRLHWGRDLDSGVEHLEYGSLATDQDRALARAGVRAAADLAAHPDLASLVAQWYGPTPEELRSDRELDAWIHSHLGTAFHLAGTAPMGPAADRHAVVGPDLRVHGVEGLRVVDASVMPVPLSRGPAATTVMIGEHAAAMFDDPASG